MQPLKEQLAHIGKVIDNIPQLQPFRLLTVDMGANRRYRFF